VLRFIEAPYLRFRHESGANNKFVVESLKARGAVFVENWMQVPDGQYCFLQLRIGCVKSGSRRSGQIVGLKVI